MAESSENKGEYTSAGEKRQTNEKAHRSSELKARKQRMEIKRKRRRSLLIFFLCLLSVFVVALVGIIAYRLYISRSLVDEIVVEAGSDLPEAQDFLVESRQGKMDVSYACDLSEIDVHHVGDYKITFDINGNECTTKLKVVDTVSPTGTVQVDKLVPLDGTIDPEDLVSDIEDETDVSCSFKEEPDLSEEGAQQVTVLLTDEGGNQTDFDTEILVFLDTQAPVIDGVAPLESFVGDTISYKGSVMVTDDFDSNVELQVDADDVDPDRTGTYAVVYTAEDSSGNQATEKTTITIKEKPENYVEPEEVYAMADEILAKITTEDMTLKEKAYEIFLWIENNLSYISTSEKDSWTNAAYTGFTQHTGDCYVFFSTAKALLTEAGIPNIDVVKSDTSHSEHYWNLVNVGDGWYHYDTLPRFDGKTFFLATDDELQEYSEKHNNSHIFDTSLYPATPKEDSTIE